MKKKSLIIGLVTVAFIITGCGTTAKQDKNKTNNSETTTTTAKSEVQSETEEKTTVSETTEVKETSAVKEETQTSTTETQTTAEEIVPATTSNMTLSVSGAEDNGQGSIAYSVTATNTSSASIEVNASLFNLNKSSAATGENETIAAANGETKVLKAGETATFSKVLGPVSGDTPGYYQLSASYNSAVFWTQAPQIQ